MGKDDRSNGPKPQTSAAARRVEAIIEGAERAAERVIDEAEANARAYLAEAEAAADRTVEARLAALAEMTDSLVDQAESIQRQAELLSRSLREAKQRLEEAEGGEPAAADPGEPAPPPRLAAVERPVEPELSAVQTAPVEALDERREHGTPAGARLLATQMAVSGSSREEIAARLRTGFEIEDADAILDAILGPEA